MLALLSATSGWSKTLKREWFCSQTLSICFENMNLKVHESGKTFHWGLSPMLSTGTLDVSNKYNKITALWRIGLKLYAGWAKWSCYFLLKHVLIYVEKKQKKTHYFGIIISFWKFIFWDADGATNCGSWWDNSYYGWVRILKAFKNSDQKQKGWDGVCGREAYYKYFRHLVFVLVFFLLTDDESVLVYEFHWERVFPIYCHFLWWSSRPINSCNFTLREVMLFH